MPENICCQKSSLLHLHFLRIKSYWITDIKYRIIPFNFTFTASTARHHRNLSLTHQNRTRLRYTGEIWRNRGIWMHEIRRFASLQKADKNRFMIWFLSKTLSAVCVKTLQFKCPILCVTDRRWRRSHVTCVITHTDLLMCVLYSFAVWVQTV